MINFSYLVELVNWLTTIKACNNTKMTTILNKQTIECDSDCDFIPPVALPLNAGRD